MKPSRHLVIGINGMIGSSLFKNLQTNGHEVSGTSHKDALIQSNSQFYLNLADSPHEKSNDKRYEWMHGSRNQFDVVYFCAGLCRMALCEDDPLGTSKINIDGMCQWADYFSKQGSFLIYLSTNQVFSGNNAYVPENAPYQPLNEYGRQKAIAEDFFISECKSSAILRLTKVIEPQMTLIQDWIERLKTNQAIEVFYDMILAPVSLHQVIQVLLSLGMAKTFGIYAISGEKDISYQELADFIACQLGASKNLVIPVSALEKGIKKNFLPRFTTMLCSSTIALCGQKPPAFQDVLHECFQF